MILITFLQLSRTLLDSAVVYVPFLVLVKSILILILIL